MSALPPSSVFLEGRPRPRLWQAGCYEVCQYTDSHFRDFFLIISNRHMHSQLSSKNVLEVIPEVTLPCFGRTEGHLTNAYKLRIALFWLWNLGSSHLIHMRVHQEGCSSSVDAAKKIWIAPLFRALASAACTQTKKSVLMKPNYTEKSK